MSSASRRIGIVSLLRRFRPAADEPDPRRAAELRGERVVFQALRRDGFLERFRGGRILEVGPKHGEDSLLLATLEPSELVLVELPEKRALVESWLPGVEARCPVRYVEANLLYMTPAELRALGRFDLIWCAGVVYHNAEQLRLLRRLFRLCRDDAALVLESSTTRDPRLRDLNVVEIHWPRPYRDSRHITHHPSRLALRSWLEMVGFADVELRDVYSDAVAQQRAVLTAIRPLAPSPHVLFASDDGPVWVAGDAPGHVEQPEQPPPAVRRRAPTRVRRPRPAHGTPRGPRIRWRYEHVLATTILALATAFFFLVFLPEELGDRPYDVFGLKF